MTGFGLAAPIWLAGLAALLLPLLLHLLARGRGRRVRVGSVRLLTAAPPRRPRRIQLQRPWLLALRCLLLAALVVALAGPRLRREPRADEVPRTWVLLDPQAAVRWRSEATGARAAEPAQRSDKTNHPGLPAPVRRAIAAGAEVRLLAPGVPARRDVADVADLPDPAAVPGGSWSLLREAAAAAPPGTPLVVFTASRMAALRGVRPAIANPVVWHELDDAGSNRWVERLVAGPSGPALLVGESDRARTTFREVPLAGTSRGLVRLPPGDFVTADDALRLPSAAVRPLRVALLTAPDRSADAGYLRAGLEAAAESARLELELVPDAAATATGGAPALASFPTRPPAVVFWLADAPPPSPVLAAVRGGAVLLSDAGRPEERCEGSWSAAPGAALVASHRCVAIASGARGDGRPVPAAAVLWRTDTGRALLTSEPFGRGRWLRLAGRLHPTWSQLVLSPAFPEWLRDLLLAAREVPSAELPISDRRSAAGQGAPATAPRGPTRTRAPLPPSRGPEVALLMLLFPLLVAERWLAGRR